MSAAEPATGALVVIGIGNALRGDDAAGLDAVARLSSGHPPGPLGAHVRLLSHEGEAIDLLELWEGAAAVVLLDCVRSGAPPGTIHRFDVSTQQIPEALQRASSHTIGVGEVIELGRRLGRLPARVIVYGIEGTRFAAGEVMSEEVAAALPELAAAVARELTEPAALRQP